MEQIDRNLLKRDGRVVAPGAGLFFPPDLSSCMTGQTVLMDGGLNLKWTHLGADNTSLFLKDEGFRAAIKK